MPDGVRVGLVGCGRIAERGYAPALRRAAGVRLTAVADPVQERCRQVAPGVAAFSGAEALLAAGLVDAVILATPASAHLEDARAAAAAGVPALVEKPPATSLAEAHDLARLDPRPHMAFNRRFDCRLAQLRPLANGVTDVRLELELRTRPGSWRAHVVRDDVLANLGPHLVDLARWLTGAEIERVRAELDGSHVSLDAALGAGATASITCIGDRPYRERVQVSAGSRRLAAYRAGGLRAAFRQVVVRDVHPLVDSLALQLEAFARTVRGERDAVLATVEDGVAVMAVLEAARLSAAAGGAWQDVPASSPAG